VERGKAKKGMGGEGLCSSKGERRREGINREREKEMARRAGRKEEGRGRGCPTPKPAR